MAEKAATKPKSAVKRLNPFDVRFVKNPKQTVIGRKVKKDDANGGNPCVGEATVTETCNIDPCPGNDGSMNLVFCFKVLKFHTSN